jgi:hypothetical protein
MQIARTHDAGGVAVIRRFVAHLRVLEPGENRFGFRKVTKDSRIKVLKVHAPVVEEAQLAISAHEAYTIAVGIIA